MLHLIEINKFISVDMSGQRRVNPKKLPAKCIDSKSTDSSERLWLRSIRGKWHPGARSVSSTKRIGAQFPQRRNKKIENFKFRADNELELIMS